MRKTLLLVAMAFLCETMPAFSSGRNTNTTSNTNAARPFYLTANAGVAWPEELTFEDEAGTGKFKFYPGLRLDVAGGYGFTPWLAAELEAGLVVNAARMLSQDGYEDNSFFLVQRVAMANVVFQLPLPSRLHAFIGAGGGGVHTSLQSWMFSSGEHSGNDFTFGYQGFAGVRYQINSQMAFGLEYKFMRTTDHGFDQLAGTRTHSLALSFKIRF